jgi:hypothetical protein
MRTLYFRRSVHVERWTPRIGQAAASYNWSSGIALFIGGACVPCYLGVFLIARAEHSKILAES